MQRRETGIKSAEASKIFRSQWWAPQAFELYRFHWPHLTAMLLLIFNLGLSSAQLGYQMGTSEGEHLMELGRQQYISLREKTNVPNYGDCWKRAIKNLHEGCQSLTENVQSGIALRFTDCFLIMSGHAPYECAQFGGVVWDNCMQKMSDRAFNAYTEFYTHTQNICFYLKSQLWHEETENTISRLSHASDKAASQIEELVDNTQNLKQALLDSQDSLLNIVSDFRATTLEQKTMLLEVFDRLSSLQEWALGEMSWLDTVMYYLFGVIISYILTATPRTQSARYLLFFTFTINIVTERCLCSYFVKIKSENVENLNEYLIWWVWLCRKIQIAVCVIILSVTAYTYRDYNIINHSLLIQIRQQNLKLLGHLEKVKMLEHVARNAGHMKSSLERKSAELNSESECLENPRELALKGANLLPHSPRTTTAILKRTKNVITTALETSLLVPEELDIIGGEGTEYHTSARNIKSTVHSRRKLDYQPRDRSPKYNLRKHK